MSSVAEPAATGHVAHRSGGRLTRAQAAILTATEQLLRERSLHELSVADIIEAAGISRTSFYAYFPSKTAVIAAGLRQVMDQVMVAVEPLHGQTGADPEAAVRVSLRQWVGVCRHHGALLRAVSEQWPHDAELRDLWFSTLAGMAGGTARVIEEARRADHAPSGAPARPLAACLMWGYERVLHVALAGGAAGRAGPDALVAPLTQLTVGGLYGRPLLSAAPSP